VAVARTERDKAVTEKQARIDGLMAELKEDCDIADKKKNGGFVWVSVYGIFLLFV
jgi:hypothetical protein